MLRSAGAGLVIWRLAERGYTPATGRGLKVLARLPLARDRGDEIRALVAGRRLAVFLDYDGTLTPIVEDYTRAFLSDRMREAVATLARRCTVAVVSGRDVTEVRKLVGLDGIYYAGSHGFEIHGPDGRLGGLEKGVEYLPGLDRVEARLRECLAGVAGHAVERKRFEISVHYRRVADADVSRVEWAVDAVLAGEPGLRKGHGKKVFRVQPGIEWDKGHAVLWLLEQLSRGQADLLPVYLGDDITDEDAFRALGGRGLTLVVRDEQDRRTAADYALVDTDDVERVLRTLAGMTGNRA